MDDSFKLVGSAIEDRYRIDAVIGEGGFGVVYRGYHLRLEVAIAVKCLKIPGHFTSEARELFLTRFKEEGRILVKLGDAPGVPRVYDYGVADQGGQKVPFLVLEWLDGQTLEDALRTRRSAGLGGINPAEALYLLLPAIDAIAVAHSHQIAHRDIKPANMILVRQAKGPMMKVLDFGIAKAMQEGEALAQAKTQTATSFRAFTPNYAAPEQFAPKRYGASGPWTDVHALGLLLLEMLSGQPANKGEDLVECLEFATSETRPSAQGRGAKISDALEAVLTKALSRSSDARYQSADLFAAALRTVPEATQVPSLPMKTFSPAEIMPQTERGEPLTPLTEQKGSTAIMGPEAESKKPDVPREEQRNSSGTLIAATGAKPAPAPTGAQGDTHIAVAIPKERAAVTSVADVPDLQKHELTAQPKKAKSKAPLLAGVGVLAIGGIAATIVLSGPGPEDGGGSTSSTVSPAPTADVKPKTEILYTYDVVGGQSHFVPVALSEADVKGTTHLRVTRQEGTVVLVDRVAPSGKVIESSAVKPQADGSWIRTKTNARQVIVETVTQTKAGVETHVNRFGYPFEQGCARWQMTFNAAGDVDKRVCQNAEGHVIIDRQGCQVLAVISNELHQFKEFRCQQEDGTPVVDATGVYSRKMSYDDKGRLTETSFFSPSGSSISDTSGCARIRVTYDGASNVKEQQCIGPTGMVTNFANMTAAAIRRAHDDNSCVLEERYVDAAGQPSAHGTIAAKTYVRNEFCEEVSYQLVDVSGALSSPGPGSVPLYEQKFDGEGNLIEYKCFDKAKKPTNCGGDTGQHGSIIRNTYDAMGRILVDKAFDQAGQPSITQRGYPHESRKTYNEVGQVVEVRYFDEAGKPATVLGNVSRRQYRYDALGSEIANSSFGVNGEPVVDLTGCHEIRRTFDDRHRLATIELRDAAGNPPKKIDLQLARIAWPKTASKLVVVRQGTVVLNKFYDASDRELRSTDCSNPANVCEQ